MPLNKTWCASIRTCTSCRHTHSDTERRLVLARLDEANIGICVFSAFSLLLVWSNLRALAACWLLHACAVSVSSCCRLGLQELGPLVLTFMLHFFLNFECTTMYHVVVVTWPIAERLSRRLLLPSPECPAENVLSGLHRQLGRAEQRPELRSWRTEDFVRGNQGGSHSMASVSAHVGLTRAELSMSLFCTKSAWMCTEVHFV